MKRTTGNASKNGDTYGDFYKILAISDLHTGSVYAPWPEKFEWISPQNDAVFTFTTSDAIQKMNEAWGEMIQTLRALGGVDCLIVNGDLVDGPAYKEYGKECITSDPLIQADACTAMLKQVPLSSRKAPIFITMGSDYHVKVGNVEVERIIGEKVKAKKVGIDLLIDGGGIRIHAQHFIASSQGPQVYWTTAPSRDSMFLSIHNAETEYGEVDAGIRSHRHNFTVSMFKRNFVVITPGWQLRTPFARKKGILTPAHIGGVLLWVDRHDSSRILIDRSLVRPQPVPPCPVTTW